MAETKALIKSTKFKVGDFITAPDRVFLRIEAVVDSGLGPMYGYFSGKTQQVHWESQYELDSQDYHLATPDFEKYETVKAGDIFKIGDSKDAPYTTVLARVGNAVLTSRTPVKGAANAMVMLDRMMKEVASELGVEVDDLTTEEDRRRIKQLGSQLHSSKMAGNWMTVEQLCLMNWTRIEE